MARVVNIDKFEVVNAIKRKIWIRGKDKVFQYTVMNAAETAVVDISAWALIKWVCCENAGDLGTPKITRTMGAGIAITSGVGGIIQVTVPNALCEIDGDREYYVELSRYDANNEGVLACGQAWLWNSPTTG